MLRQDVMGRSVCRQNDDRLAKHVDINNRPILLVPFAIRPPAMRPRSLMDIANYRQWLGARRQWQGRNWSAPCDNVRAYQQSEKYDDARYWPHRDWNGLNKRSIFWTRFKVQSFDTGSSLSTLNEPSPSMVSSGREKESLSKRPCWSRVLRVCFTKLSWLSV